MNGAKSLVDTLVAGGIDACFTNPGTSEMHLVAALDGEPRIRCVLTLFEGVATAAADGYARMAGKPACTLLHLGPGLANGLANLHNAGRARVPLVNLIGEHALHHLHFDAPLTSDIEGTARPYCKWLRTSRDVSTLGADAAEAIWAARTPPGQIATLIVPVDVAWNEGGAVGAIMHPPIAAMPAASVVEQAASLLRSGRPTILLLAGDALYGKGLTAAAKLAAATGARLLAPYPIMRIQRGAGAAVVDRLPYVPDLAADLLKDYPQIILVGAAAPVAYFAAQNRRSELTPPGCKIFTLAQPQEDCAGSLEALLDACSARGQQPQVEKLLQAALPAGPITQTGVAATLAALLPENCIVVDESMTTGRGVIAACRGSMPHDVLTNTGGSIGIAMPLAVGAATACPERRVLCLSADGSGMYTAQALWSMAREQLKVTVVVFANRQYAILKKEFQNLGMGEPGPRATSLFEIGRPDLDWVSLAKGMGVPGRRIASLEEFAKALTASYESDGPTLIEIPF